MKKISTGQSYSKKSIFLCKKVDPDYLGQEIYADRDIKTPYTFYLIRKLDLDKDYRSLSEGAEFVSLIQEEFVKQEEAFSDIVLKKIYVYAEAECLYYTIEFGSFQPTNVELRKALKRWFAGLRVGNNNQAIITESEMSFSTNQLATQDMMKQLVDTSNEITRLKEIIHTLNDSIGNLTSELSNKHQDSATTRKVQTVYLKRPKLLGIEEKDTERKQIESSSVITEDSKVQAVYDQSQNKHQSESKYSPEDVSTDRPKPEKNNHRNAKLSFVLNKSMNVYKIQNWEKFMKVQENHPHKLLSSRNYSNKSMDLPELEDKIFKSFVDKQNLDKRKKKRSSKISVHRSEIIEKISQAEYLTYSWEQVISQRKKDILIRNRLNCSNLVHELDSFLDKMREIAYSRSFMSKRVRCLEADWKKLNGYILLDKYMETLYVEEY